MDIRVIHYFISIYEEGSFAKAAERMHVVPSALSMQIRNLEDELKTPLFTRSPKKLEPTLAGRRFYELCVPIARNLASAKQEIFDLMDGRLVAGSIRIGITSAMCQGILGNVLAEFYENYPNVEVTVMEAYSRNITDLLQEGSLDLGLGALPLDRNSLVCRLGFKDSYALVSMQPINGPSFTPCDLFATEGLKLVIPSERHLLGATIQSYVSSGQIRPQGVLKIDGVLATRESIKHLGWGALCLVTSIIDRLDSPSVYIYPLINPHLQFDLYILYNVKYPLTMAARKFLEIIESKLKSTREIWEEAVRTRTVTPGEVAGS